MNISYMQNDSMDVDLFHKARVMMLGQKFSSLLS